MRMFGLFSYEDVYDKLYEHLVSSWEMKEKYAKAFLDAYRKNISKIHSQGKKRLSALSNSNNTTYRLLGIIGEGDQNNYALVGQAYQAYMSDLRRGKYVGSDVELAIWAILANRSDLLETIDRAFVRYIDENAEKKFPNLFETVFKLNT